MMMLGRFFFLTLFPLAFSAGRENVLIMIADDAGLQSSVYGNHACLTPNLKNLAKRSTIFNNAFTVVSSCSPSRSSILTGLPPHQNGMYGLHQGYHNFNSFEEVKSLPQIASSNGIRTGIIGKKHVGPESVYPFDFAYTEENNSILQVGRNISRIRELVRMFLQSNDSRPFLLYVAFHDPHRCGHTHPQFGQFCEKFGNGDPGMGFISDWHPVYYNTTSVEVPYYVQDTPAAREDIAAQYTTISRLDQGVRVVIKELCDSGHIDDTLIIFSSDNGIPFPSGRTNTYDPGIIEPLLVSSPINPDSWGKQINNLTSLLDITPTVLDWFNISYPNYFIHKRYEPVNLTGKSLLPLLSPKNKRSNENDGTVPVEDEAIFVSHTMHEVTMYYPMRTIRTKRYKLIHNLNYKMPFPIDQDFYLAPVFQDILNRTKNNISLPWYKTLKEYYYRPEWEMYDLKVDPEERYNVFNKESYRRAFYQLYYKLWDWQSATNDPWICSPHYVLQDSGPYSAHHQCLPLYNGIVR